MRPAAVATCSSSSSSGAASCAATCAAPCARRSRPVGWPTAPACRRPVSWRPTFRSRAGWSRTPTTSSSPRAISRSPRARLRRSGRPHRPRPPARTTPGRSRRPGRTGPSTSWRRRPTSSSSRGAPGCAPPSERSATRRTRPSTTATTVAASSCARRSRLPGAGPRRARHRRADRHHPGLHPGAGHHLSRAAGARRDDDRLRDAVAADGVGDRPGVRGAARARPGGCRRAADRRAGWRAREQRSSSRRRTSSRRARS